MFRQESIYDRSGTANVFIHGEMQEIPAWKAKM